MNTDIKYKVINIFYRLKNYSLLDFSKGKDQIVFCFDENRGHPGLVDRLKAIVGLYYIAKNNGLGFKLSGFNWLEKYFMPNKMDWALETKERFNSMWNVRLLSYNPLKKIPNNLRGEYHVYNYIGKNILETNKVDNWEGIWHQLFTELFRFTDYTYKLVNANDVAENKYIAIHIRFVNALELSEPKYPQKPLEKQKRLELIDKCINKLTEIQTTSRLPVYVFSDSKFFLKKAKEEGFIVSDGEIGNISYNGSESIMDKSFQDLLIMSRAQKVIRFRGEHLYESAYSRYAAIIGNKEYKIVEI